ncbi:MAG: DUF554 domain-containing protein [Clostridia bacterium]|nr:DUF554 domain-containing protein [Clostridia bacterium]
MIGLGTLINTGAIVAGGLLARLVGPRLQERHQSTLTVACGVSTLFVGISGAMEGMLKLENGGIASRNGMLVVICLTLGALIGEIINLEDAFERFGTWLKVRTGNAGDQGFVHAFVTASLTVCIGAMAIVGSIQDGIHGDYSILAVKSILDLIIILVMASSLGKGAAFSALPVFMLEGGMTLLARVLQPLMTEQALGYLSMIGSILIFCVGLNLVWGKKVRVANLLPAIVLAVIAAAVGI